VLLGKFKLSNINNPLPGRATFVVTFEVNEDGILSVTASEEGANNTNQITLTRNQGWGRDGTVKDYKRLSQIRDEMGRDYKTWDCLGRD
jgi:molecular chaperone DnaK (HSP70)